MYFVDREKIEKTLAFFEKNLEFIETTSKWTSFVEKKALERISQLLIESILDVGNSMIDGFIMRDPGSYDDIIDILEDEKVVEVNQAKELKEVVRFRKVLVQDYLEIDHTALLAVLKDNTKSLKSFPQSIRTYLETELGPVSAFKN
ncbi:type VII toxin-antitoxin system HepT family RNase toxin [Fredinandcohnia sp. 179-A 10B2 NHS]|uniref:type VII toxin-antitoxin system HepT family RNase toxin n=1 Tax=Fredinandcohnia sp. 179-A 10B2 NHS TaxID=3235176 RepID=UPI00399FD35F